MIHFKLQELDRISPFGRKPELSLHWFGLTDGDLWLSFGNETIYEYSKEAIAYFEKPTPYVDYQISRFIEDFTELFKFLSESIPKDLYERTNSMKEFRDNAEIWLDLNESDDDDESSEFYFNEYNNLISWIDDRTLYSAHIGGPAISFIRCGEKVKILWDSEGCQLDNGIKLWTATIGFVEVLYLDFVSQVKDFGNRFFEQMNKQVKFAIEKDWGDIKLDKNELVKEHAERENTFHQRFTLLVEDSKIQSDWKLVDKLNQTMLKELQKTKT